MLYAKAPEEDTDLLKAEAITEESLTKEQLYGRIPQGKIQIIHEPGNQEFKVDGDTQNYIIYAKVIRRDNDVQQFYKVLLSPELKYKGCMKLEGLPPEPEKHLKRVVLPPWMERSMYGGKVYDRYKRQVEREE